MNTNFTVSHVIHSATSAHARDNIRTTVYKYDIVLQTQTQYLK